MSEIFDKYLLWPWTWIWAEIMPRPTFCLRHLLTSKLSKYQLLASSVSCALLVCVNSELGSRRQNWTSFVKAELNNKFNGVVNIELAQILILMEISSLVSPSHKWKGNMKEDVMWPGCWQTSRDEKQWGRVSFTVSEEIATYEQVSEISHNWEKQHNRERLMSQRRQWVIVTGVEECEEDVRRTQHSDGRISIQAAPGGEHCWSRGGACAGSRVWPDEHGAEQGGSAPPLHARKISW